MDFSAYLPTIIYKAMALIYHFVKKTMIIGYGQK